MTYRSKAGIWFVTVAGAALLAASGAVPANATVIDRGAFAGTESNVSEELCGISLIRDSTFSGSYRIRVDKASDGQAFLQRQNFKYSDVFTNPVSGRSMTFEGKVLNNELTATQIEGSIYSFTTIEAGQPFTVRDAAGNVVLRDRGVIRHSLLFDTLGDSTPGGVVLDDTIIGVGGPHPGLDQSDDTFCEMVQALVG